VKAGSRGGDGVGRDSGYPSFPLAPLALCFACLWFLLLQVKLRNVSEVVAGQGTEVFRRYPLRDGAASFSLRYRDEDGGSRTLDLTAADPQQLELWLVGLRVVAARLAALGTPVSLAAAPGGGGLPPPDLARRAAARLHAAPGPLCMDAGERTPCDLLAWGAAQRAPAAAPSARSVLGVADDCWQHRAAPAPAPGALRLDAFRAAVGRKHAAVITATGALYAWGEGRGGKLGLGHDQDQAVPQKVRHVLDGRVLAAVACGDDCTAALTDAGELFVWGRLHVDARPQLVPLRVRGELRSRRVVQVGCSAALLDLRGTAARGVATSCSERYSRLCRPAACVTCRPLRLKGAAHLRLRIPSASCRAAAGTTPAPPAQPPPAGLLWSLPLRRRLLRRPALHVGGGLWRQAGPRRPRQPLGAGAGGGPGGAAGAGGCLRRVAHRRNRSGTRGRPATAAQPAQGRRLRGGGGRGRRRRRRRGRAARQPCPRRAGRAAPPPQQQHQLGVFGGGRGEGRGCGVGGGCPSPRNTLPRRTFFF
jgi:hypothetical protein